MPVGAPAPTADAGGWTGYRPPTLAPDPRYRSGVITVAGTLNPYIL